MRAGWGVVGVLVVIGAIAEGHHDPARSDAGARAEPPGPQSTAGVTGANTGNRGNDLFLGLSESDQQTYIGKVVGDVYGVRCAATRVFYRGISGIDHSAFWSAGCRGGRSYQILIEADAAGTTTVLDCGLLGALSGEDCFSPLGTPVAERSKAQTRAAIDALPPSVKKQAMETLARNRAEANEAPSDENEACDVNGTVGTCLDVSACEGTHTPGHCPRSGGNVQCCTADAPVPAESDPEGLLCCDGSMSPSCGCDGSHRGCCSHHGGVCGCR